MQRPDSIDKCISAGMLKSETAEYRTSNHIVSNQHVMTNFLPILWLILFHNSERVKVV